MDDDFLGNDDDFFENEIQKQLDQQKFLSDIEEKVQQEQYLQQSKSSFYKSLKLSDYPELKTYVKNGNQS